MAKITKTWSYSGLRKESITIKNCVLTSNYAIRQYGAATVERRVVERRPKPPNLTVLSAMTAQELVKTQYAVYPLWRQDKTYIKPCNSLTQVVTAYRDVPWSWWTLDLETNWALALRLKINSEAVSFAESIGEFRETLNAFGKFVESTVKLARKVWLCSRNPLKCLPRKTKRVTWVRDLNDPRRKKRVVSWIPAPKPSRTALNGLDTVINADLALKWGIAPNLDLLNETLEELQAVGVMRKRFQVTLKNRRSHTVTVNANGSYVDVDERVVQRAVVWVSFNDASKFTSGNLAEALWAGVPLSFVLDWAVNVGAYLTGLTALNNVSKLEGTLSTTRLATAVVSRKLAATAPTEYVAEPGKGARRSHQRTLLSQTLPFGYLEWKPSVDLDKLMSMLEVARLMFR